MKRFVLPLAALLAVLSLAGCARMMTQLSSPDIRRAPVVRNFSDPETPRSPDQVSVLVLLDLYGLTVDGILIREPEGRFGQNLAISRTGSGKVYIVELSPGVHTLSVVYNALTPGGQNPLASGAVRSGQVTAGIEMPVPSSLRWNRTSETRHTLQPGAVYGVGLKLMSVTGEIDLYPLEGAEKEAAAQARSQAEY
jgi:hypothetical protein